MTTAPFKLKNAPIIEAVLDVECDMPPKYSLSSVEASGIGAFKDQYPKFRKHFFQEFKLATKQNEAPVHSVVQGVQALQFLKPDDKQLVQLRNTGFSFNRLAPYGSLDDYLPEIQRTWMIFVGLAKPAQMRLIRLRYINRLLLPLDGTKLDLDKFLRIGPRLPDEQKLTFTGFLNQHSVMEVATGHKANIVLTTQLIENGCLPVIFDIAVEAQCREEPSKVDFFLTKIQALRDLKNSIFKDTLTEECITRFL